MCTFSFCFCFHLAPLFSYYTYPYLHLHLHIHLHININININISSLKKGDRLINSSPWPYLSDLVSFGPLERLGSGFACSSLHIVLRIVPYFGRRASVQLWAIQRGDQRSADSIDAAIGQSLLQTFNIIYRDHVNQAAKRLATKEGRLVADPGLIG